MSYYDPLLACQLRKAFEDLGVQANDYPAWVRNYYIICVLDKHLPQELK